MKRDECLVKVGIYYFSGSMERDSEVGGEALLSM
jgi:hypothetical protein